MIRTIIAIGLFLSVLVHISFSQSQDTLKGEIVGTVLDKSTQQPLPSVNVLIIGTGMGSVTDADGRFMIKNIPVGTYLLKASLVGYQTVVKTDIVVATGHKTQVMFALSEAVVNMDEVTVKANYFHKELDVVTSVHSLNYEEVRRAPGAAGDVSRVMQSLPGVSTSSDNRNDLIVRGGSPAENLTIVDNIEVPTINHFATQGASGGAIGMMNTDFIREAKFITGGFPAKYGDKLSSVLDIELREGSRENFQGDVYVSAGGFGGTFEGPISNRGSWMFSARKSYLDFLVKELNTFGVTIVPNYSDFQAKVAYDIDQSNKLSFIGLGGIDRTDFANVEKENMGFNPDLSGIDNVVDRHYEYVLGINWKSLWHKSGYSIVTVSNNLNKYFTDVTDSHGNKTYYNNSVEQEYQIKGEAAYQFNAENGISFGASFKLVSFDHSIFVKADTSMWADRIKGTGIFPELDIDSDITTYKSYAYLQYNRWLFNRLNVTLGLRYDYFDYVTHQHYVSTRFGLSYHLTDRTTLNASFGIFFQSPIYIWLTTDQKNRNLKDIRADHYVFGVEHLLKEDTRFTLEFFDKEYRDYPVSGYIPSYILVNGGADYGAFIAGDLRSDGIGYVRGVELFLQKKLTESFYGTLSYTYSFSKFKAGDGLWRPGNFDCRNTLTMIMGYKFSNEWEFSVRWRYASGRPYTPIDEVASRYYGRQVMDISSINALRYPDYHRLDVRFDYRWNLGSWNLITYLDIQNAYNQKNIFYYLWDEKRNKQVTIYQWSVLPIIGISAEF